MNSVPPLGYTMAFYDFLFGSGPSAVKRHTRRIADRDAQPEDREASAKFLSENASDDALLGLLARFNLQLEHSMKDQREKEYVLDLLAGHGARASTAARAYARSNVTFPWAVRLVERLEGAAPATELLLDLLAAEKVENEWKPDKKRALLIQLAERRDPRITAAASRFLADFDEGVRNAALEAMAAQEGDDGREALLRLLANPHEESTRIRGRLAEVFATRGWPVGEDPWLLAHVPTGYRLSEGRLVAAR